ncbi:translation initiation factor 2 (IF-2, GTPase) [Pseudomonas sp. RW407]|uniref:translation initiation factor 2 (IF-2, GTPase) n=1 Tax=Pseudomonas sp. RW407 TaxID=2202894 RepID=UPI000D6FE6A6|nr:translation initiation factor 2 (IF-2, GTPase) [Pseudomonas sp. RW407]PWU31045.1 translation initiation factor 2 (IF-2, GTPase) [Pseudomonas sp. RW407]
MSRRHLLPLLFCLSLPLAAHGEEPTATPGATPASDDLAQLQQRLDESEKLRADLAAQLQGAESAVVGRLRQENQRLKLQLRELQAQQPPRLLSDEQTWFATGGAVALVAFVLGALSRGRRRRRREWIN